MSDTSPCWTGRHRAARAAARGKAVSPQQPAAVYLGSAFDHDEDQAPSEQVRKAAREQTTKVLDRLGDSAPPQANVDAISGSPAEELLRAAQDADLLVVGARGAGVVARLVMGSVSSQVSHQRALPGGRDPGRRTVNEITPTRAKGAAVISPPPLRARSSPGIISWASWGAAG